MWKVAPVFLSYGLSFLVVAIMWVNHHHLIHAVHGVTARLLWSNLYLLFWMSLVPFVTDYLGKNYHEPLAVALYGMDLVLCSSAFYLLRIILVEQDNRDGDLADYHRSIQRKNAFSAALYLSSVPLAYVSVYASFFIFASDSGDVLPARKEAGEDRTRLSPRRSLDLPPDGNSQNRSQLFGSYAARGSLK